MKNSIIALLVGMFFGLGLVISGMTNPHKVINFLNFTQSWDPSLAFVMLGAIGVHTIAYRIIKHRTSPLLGGDFKVPKKNKIDKQLIIGSAIFGIGWGLGGYCPGPAIASLVSLKTESFIFMLTMILGMQLHSLYEKKIMKGMN
ncbi:MAG: YeeE/YedE family protein [Bdellovibrionota bacterium]